MMTISNKSVSRDLQMAEAVGEWRRPFELGLTISQTLRLWCARHRHRHELAMLSDRDMKDLRLSHDLATHELRKWPWQKFHPRWREMDDVLRRGLVVRDVGEERKVAARGSCADPGFLPPTMSG